MKTILLTTILFLPFFAGNLFAQPPVSSRPSSHVLDTIFANDSKNVALFFPAPIRQGITGAENFAFTYNREKEQNFGLLQAQPGDESNLLIISSSGAVFSYIVAYKKQLERLNYFISEDQRIGSLKPANVDTIQTIATAQKAGNIDSYFKRFSDFLIDRNQRIGRIKIRRNGIALSVENIVFQKEALYFVMEIENASTLDYDLDYLKFYIQTRKQGKKKSIQKLEIEPLYVYRLPVKIPEKQSKRMVFVVPKFSLARDKQLLIELKERNGERALPLKVKPRFINNPN
ncbi:uncharacterized protein DUF4138 [Christiangramia gaetbulicola]|uniref:Uncharacterized protein DUF4138 n=1 Tax=Christiangramia gaetbulicola TaxID=703340 RepID=A0A2T6AIF0_9FLAO|nr:DUF4138 domain-containing protein [Christiangramia gaetbulicola]PTX43583.1 uncharacterized protein DUF4138 [Christiangramia gaetbulicola]